MPRVAMAAVPSRLELRLERSIANAFTAIAHNPIRYALVAVASGLVIGGTVFSLIESDTNVVDGVWWAFVSMTTVGYGDIAPRTTGIRMLATFVILTGIAATAILTAALAGRIAEARLSESGLTLDLDDDFDVLAARIAKLKERYTVDERHDDMLLRHATYAVETWKRGQDHEPALKELDACVRSHPEREERRHGA
jgi:voltage-gated potassium channel Kch